MSADNSISRRTMLTGTVGMLGLGLTGCVLPNNGIRDDNAPQQPVSPGRTGIPREYALAYGPKPDERFPLPAIPLDKVPRKYWRREVSFDRGYQPGTLLVDTSSFYLYNILGNGRAMRYGVGLGRAGFEWSGTGRIAWKRAWPTWTPPAEMIEREPELEKWSAENGGMPPGLTNPLGARALYIFEGNRDTLYRLHGSPEYWSIGKAVSSGCVRLMNQDIIHLYNNVRNNATLIVS